MKYILQILISFYLLFSFQFLMLFIQTDRLSDLLIIETLVDFSFQITSRAEVSLAVRLKMFSNILFIFFSLNKFPQDEDHDHHGQQEKNHCLLETRNKAIPDSQYEEIKFSLKHLLRLRFLLRPAMSGGVLDRCVATCGSRHLDSL